MDMYALFLVVQLIVRLLIYTFIGKGLLALLAGPVYRDNVVWRFFDAVTRPVWWLTRVLTPRFVHDAAIAWLAVLLLIALNIGLYMLFYSQGWITPPRTTGPA
ncbi:MAG: hypothetical protein PHR30_06450 [Gallionellaceae bacterium]|nr:hypothetical protein [Gallionellaceae bacterium]MDD5364964.1 hypothetical protein [Gallionellaceae bacterium]